MMIAWTASQPYYRRHLLPILDGLVAAGHEVVALGTDMLANVPVIVAGRIDAERVGRRQPRRLVLVEHGAGQRYWSPTRGGWLDGSGGPPDPNVTLFLAPSDRVAHQMAAHVPNADRRVIGSPAVEHLAQLRSVVPSADRCRHVFTVHWQMTPIGVPEAGSSFPWSLKVLDRMNPGRVLVHSHPRIQQRMRLQAHHRMLDWSDDWDHAAAHAALLVADNTSVMWEALTVGIPVVAITPPSWSDDAPHGFPRFGADRVQLPTITIPVDTTAIIESAAEQPVFDPGVYDIVHGATDRAVSVILSHVAD